MAAARFRPATVRDLGALIRLQAAYYREDGYPFAKAVALRCWRRLLADPVLGRCWVAVAGGRVVGYVVLTLGYSLEYRGRDAFVDELYVTPARRGRGLGRQALAVVEAACVEVGVRALHLEVERSKADAQRLYRRWGFVDQDRLLMTRRLGRRTA